MLEMNIQTWNEALRRIALLETRLELAERKIERLAAAEKSQGGDRQTDLFPFTMDEQVEGS